MIMSRLDSSGGVLSGDFARYVADEQKALAFTLKQQRLFSEEEDKRKGRQSDGKGDKKDEMLAGINTKPRFTSMAKTGGI